MPPLPPSLHSSLLRDHFTFQFQEKMEATRQESLSLLLSPTHTSPAPPSVHLSTLHPGFLSSTHSAKMISLPTVRQVPLDTRDTAGTNKSSPCLGADALDSIHSGFGPPSAPRAQLRTQGLLVATTTTSWSLISHGLSSASTSAHHIPSCLTLYSGAYLWPWAPPILWLGSYSNSQVLMYDLLPSSSKLLGLLPTG